MGDHLFLFVPKFFVFGDEFLKHKTKKKKKKNRKNEEFITAHLLISNLGLHDNKHFERMNGFGLYKIKNELFVVLGE